MTQPGYRPDQQDLAEPWLRMSVSVALAGAAGRFELAVDLDVARGSFVALIGPSGAGKTTLLRVLAGLSKPDAGSVRVAGVDWCDTATRKFLPTRHRPIGFVFQDYALFPNMTVRGNVEYAIGSPKRPDEVTRLLALAGLDRLQQAFPARLSGGQRQRLALIRALARRPALLMLDEPLSALDPDTRLQLQRELRRLHHEFGTTTVLVSHDPAEILRLADRVVRLEQGRVSYDGPAAGAFGFAGEVDCIVGHHISGPDAQGCSRVCVDGRVQRVRYRSQARQPASGDLVMLRPDEIEVRPESPCARCAASTAART